MLVDKANLDAANRAFETSVNDTLGQRPPGVWSQFTKVVPASGTTNFSIPVVDGLPALREWIGAKQVGDARAYSQNFSIRKWERTIGIEVDQFNGDNLGIVVGRLQDFVQDQAVVYDNIVISEFLQNPNSYDGVSLINNSHPNQHTDGVSDNNLATALSFADFRTAVETLRDMKDEAGEPLNKRPTHLLVGPAQEELAQQVTGSDKPVGLANTGEPATSSVVESQKLTNYIGGSVSVIISNRITDNTWALMDLSGPSMPLFLAEWQAPRADVKNDPMDDNVFFNDEILYSITAKVAPAGGDWRSIVGAISP